MLSKYVSTHRTTHKASPYVLPWNRRGYAPPVWMIRHQWRGFNRKGNLMKYVMTKSDLILVENYAALSESAEHATEIFSLIKNKYLKKAPSPARYTANQWTAQRQPHLLPLARLAYSLFERSRRPTGSSTQTLAQRLRQRPLSANGVPHHQRRDTRLAQYRLRLAGWKKAVWKTVWQGFRQALSDLQTDSYCGR